MMHWAGKKRKKHTGCITTYMGVYQAQTMHESANIPVQLNISVSTNLSMLPINHLYYSYICQKCSENMLLHFRVLNVIPPT